MEHANINTDEVRTQDLPWGLCQIPQDFAPPLLTPNNLCLECVEASFDHGIDAKILIYLHHQKPLKNADDNFCK